jgi:hypothetical protein
VTSDDDPEEIQRQRMIDFVVFLLVVLGCVAFALLVKSAN